MHNLLFPQQIANYVTNGSFESILDYNSPFIDFKAKGWSGIDSTKFIGELFSVNYGNAPVSAFGYQMPRHGKTYIRLQLLYTYNPPPGNFSRSNLRNRLKQPLLAGTTYCVKMFVNTQDSCPTAIDGFGFYFGNHSIDTINYNSRLPLTFLTPQIANQNGNIINDTMNWVQVTGTFVATGIEKYMIVGNFKSDAATNTASTGVTLSSMPNGVTFSVYNIDAISCIPINLPAYAGPDKWFIPGDSVYIGRESDVEIDESCIWYQITSPTTSVTIDTIAGLWVKPVLTSTYVVRQQLWCSGVKWDTVVVSISGVGISEMESLLNNIKLYPNPASDYIQVQYSLDQSEPFNNLSIFNNLGQLIREEEIAFKHKKASVRIEELDNGVYFLELKNPSGQTVKKRFVVAR